MNFPRRPERIRIVKSIYDRGAGKIPDNTVRNVPRTVSKELSHIVNNGGYAQQFADRT